MKARAKPLLCFMAAVPGLLALMFFVAPAPQPPAEGAAPLVSGELPVLRLILSLSAVAAGLAALAWFGRRFLTTAGFQKQNRLRILESLALAPKSRLVLVRIDGREFALGITEHNINVVVALSPQQASEAPQPEITTRSERLSRFASLLRSSSDMTSSGTD